MDRSRDVMRNFFHESSHMLVPLKTPAVITSLWPGAFDSHLHSSFTYTHRIPLSFYPQWHGGGEVVRKHHPLHPPHSQKKHQQHQQDAKKVKPFLLFLFLHIRCHHSLLSLSLLLPPASHLHHINRWIKDFMALGLPWSFLESLGWLLD